MNKPQFVGRLSVGAVVLAGGLARRMNGRDKGLIELADKPMVEWVIEAISSQVDGLIINANRNLDQYGAYGYPVCEDNISGHLGPLAGLQTGLLHLDFDAVFMCPCDSPFVPTSMVFRLVDGLVDNNADIAVAHDGDRLQPVFCLVRRSVNESLRQFLESGERKIDRWYAGENVTQVDFSDTPDAFSNINTETERLAAEHRLREKP